MSRTTGLLESLRWMNKLYQKLLKQICKKYDLSWVEANIISFLSNNPQRDTAGDIVELRMLSKGNVSAGVEGLIQKSLLERIPDQRDRRRIHLHLLPKAQPITADIQAGMEEFQNEIFCGFSPQEVELLEQLNTRIWMNTQNAMKRRDLI